MSPQPESADGTSLEERLVPSDGVLVAGDALGTEGGRPTLPRARFTIDMEGAKASVVKLGGLT